MRKRHLLAVLAAFFTLFGWGRGAIAQDWDGAGWTVKIASDRALKADANGARHEVVLDLEVDKGHYVYLWFKSEEAGRSDRITVEASADGAPVAVEKIRFPHGKEKHEELLDRDVAVYETGHVAIPVELSFSGAKSKKVPLVLSVQAQACTKGYPKGDYCKFPTTVELKRRLSLVAVAPTATPAEVVATATATAAVMATEVVTATEVVAATPEATSSPDATQEPTPALVVRGSDDDDDGGGADGADGAQRAGFFALLNQEDGLAIMLERGLFWVLIFCFLGGLLVNLTPCVYPLIPITVSVIGAKGASSRGKAFTLAFFYVLGLSAVNAALGLIAGFSGQRVGFMFDKWYVVLGVAVLLFVLALGMFGVYSLQLPPSLQTKLNRFGGEGPAGVFVMGLVAGVVASPCSTPVLSGITLTIVAGNVGWAKGAALMGMFSAGLGLPFLVLGTFSGLLTSLPKSGNWMNTVKYVMGLGLIVGGYYFFEKAVPDWGFELSLGIGFVIAGVFLGAGQVLAAEAGGWRKLGKATGILATVVGIYFVLAGLSGSGWGPNIFPSNTAIVAPTQTLTNNTIPWRHSEPEAVLAANSTNKPMFIDFFTEDCTPCKQLDKHTFTDPEVVTLLSQDFIAAKLDLTKRGATEAEQEEIDRLTAKYNAQGGVPRLMVVTPEGKILEGLTRTGFEDPQALTERLQKALTCLNLPQLVCKL